MTERQLPPIPPTIESKKTLTEKEQAKIDLFKEQILSYYSFSQAIYSFGQFSPKLKEKAFDEIQEAALEGMKERLSAGHINKALEIRDAFSFPPELLDTEEIRESALSGVKASLSNGKQEKALKIKEVFHLSAESLANKEIKECASLGFKKSIAYGWVKEAAEIEKDFPLSPEDFDSILLEGVDKYLADIDHDGSLYFVNKIQEAFHLKQETLNKVAEMVMAEMLIGVRHNQVEEVSKEIRKIQKKFKIPEEMIWQASAKAMKNSLLKRETLKAPEIQEAFSLPLEKLEEMAFETIKEALAKNETYAACDTQRVFPISAELLAKEEIRGPIFALIKRWIITDYDIEDASELSKIFCIPSEMMEEVAVEGIKNNLRDGRLHPERAVSIRETFQVSQEMVEKASAEATKKNLLWGNTGNALKIQAVFPLSKETLENISFEAIKECLSGENIHEHFAFKIQQDFPLPANILESEEMMQTTFEAIKKMLADGSFENARDFLEIFPLSPEKQELAVFEGMKQNLLTTKNVNRDTLMIQQTFHLSPERLESAAFEGIKKRLLAGDMENAQKIQEYFPLPPELLASPEIHQAAFEGIKKKLSDGKDTVAKTIKETFSVTFNSLESKEIEDASLEGMFVLLATGNTLGAVELKTAFPVSENKIEPIVFNTIRDHLSRTHSRGLENALDIQEAFPLPPELFHGEKMKQAAFDGVVQCISIGNIDYAKENQKYFPLSSERLASEEIQNASTEGMNYKLSKGNIYETFQIQKSFPSKENPLSTEESCKLLFEKIKNEFAWNDERNISRPFQVGASHFGYKKMFEYLSREGLTLHDGLHNFEKIVNMYFASGVSAEQFYSQILRQVADDNSEYDEGCAQKKLNSVVNNINPDIEKTLEMAKQYTDIKKLNEIVEVFQNNTAVFSSWKYLKKYEELCSLLGRTEILDNLRGLRAEGKEKLADYIETLAFHPNVSMSEVLQFWRNPKQFFGASDAHTPERVQNQKKPSNYFNIPHLDLSAEQLRDALVEGAYDKIQSFSPFEIEYTIDSKQNSENYSTLQELISRALGKRDNSVIAEAKDAKALFAKVNNAFKEKNISLKDFLASSDTEKDFPAIDDQFTNEVRSLLFDPNIGIPIKTEGYRVKISKKSDPDAVVAGNDTACCMPFGSGKNNVYTFNPACALLLVQKKNADGIWRTVAQSVVTPDKDIKANISEIKQTFETGNAHMSDVLGQDVLADTPSILTFDNIEVASGFKGNDAVIGAMYHDFSRRYLSKQKSGSFDESRAIIGQGYTDAMTYLPQIENTFLPETPVGYSDNLHHDSLLLDLSKRSGEENKIIRSLEKESADMLLDETTPDYLPKGVSPLTFRDSLEVAYLEGKAYSTNESLIQHLWNMENALIAKDVNNSAKGRENMSFSYKGTDNMTHGYLLAYEGGRTDAPFLYIADLASDGNLKAGGSLIKAFAEGYKKNYVEKKNLIPLYAEFRENTSYQIIRKQIDKLSEEIGVTFILEERGTYSVGNDTMHRIFIYPESLADKQQYNRI
jgi:hypothetical protein